VALKCADNSTEKERVDFNHTQFMENIPFICKFLGTRYFLDLMFLRGRYEHFHFLGYIIV
jgi:hypothetical protein